MTGQKTHSFVEELPTKTLEKNLINYVTETTFKELVSLSFSFFCSFIYVFFGELLKPLFFFAKWRHCFCPLKQYFCHEGCKPPAKKGVIRQYICPKTGRTYALRYLDVDRDYADAAGVLSSAFAKDPFNEALFNENRKKHSFSASWFLSILRSPSVRVVLQEWLEQEKIVGVIIFTNGSFSYISSFIDSFWLIVFFLKHLFEFSLYDIQRMILVVLGLQQRYSEMCESFQQPCGLIKFLAVEKGFQGQGIGSSLLQVAIDHFDENGILSYLESSNIANIPLYSRFGYKQFEKFHICRNFPPLYLMLREPKLLEETQHLNKKDS